MYFCPIIGNLQVPSAAFVAQVSRLHAPQRSEGDATAGAATPPLALAPAEAKLRSIKPDRTPAKPEDLSALLKDTKVTLVNAGEAGVADTRLRTTASRESLSVKDPQALSLSLIHI